MKNKVRRYKKITKKRLEECLNLVGWSIRNHGCGHYFLYNSFGKITNFVFNCQQGEENKPLYDLRIDEFNNKKPFGETPESYIHGGICSFIFKGCDLEVVYRENSDEIWFVLLVVKNDRAKQAAYICFNKKD